MSSSPKKSENDSLVDDVHKTSIAVAKQEKPDKSKQDEATASGTKHESAKRRGSTMAKAAIPGAKAVNSKASTQPTSDTTDRDVKQCARVMVKATVPVAVASTSGSVSKQVVMGGAPKVSSHLVASLMEPPSKPSITLETTARYQGQKEVVTLASSDRDAKQCGRVMVKATVPGAVASASGSVSEQVAMSGASKVSSHLAPSLIEPPSEPSMPAETTARDQGQEEGATLSSLDRGAKQRERAMAKASDPSSVVVHEGATNPGAVSVEPSFLTEPSSDPFSQSSSSIDFCDDAILGDSTMDPTFAANESVGPTILEAIKVEDEYIPEAMAVSEEEINKKGCRRCMFFLCVLVIAVLISVTIAVMIAITLAISNVRSIKEYFFPKN